MAGTPHAVDDLPDPFDLRPLADDPQQAVAPIVDLIGGAHWTGNPWSGHAIAGNNALYEETSVQLDRRWHRNMSRRDRAVTVALTAPLLYRYGYPLGVQGNVQPD